jgi:hypothetical protein
MVNTFLVLLRLMGLNPATITRSKKAKMAKNLPAMFAEVFEHYFLLLKVYNKFHRFM